MGTWDSEVAKAAAHWGPVYGITIPPALVHAIIERESRHGRDPRYVAGRGIVLEPGGHRSFGPMQVYDDTVHALNATLEPEALAKSPALGIWYGTHYLAQQLKRFGGDVAAAISAYNAGPGNARRGAAGKFPNQDYVDAVLRFWKASPALALAPVLLAVGAGLYLLSRRRRAA